MCAQLNARGAAYADIAGHRWLNSAFGEMIVGQRRPLISGAFMYGLPPDVFTQIRRWDTSGGAGVFNVNERVVGGTSGAIGIIEDIANPALIRTLSGTFTTGETITGVGVTATASGATRVITIDTAGNGLVQGFGKLNMTAGTDTTTDIAVESKFRAGYLPGHELMAMFTANFTAGIALITQFVGMFTSGGLNGYGVGYSGTSFGFLHRQTGATVSFVAKSAWNIDRFDGGGGSNNPSGMTLNPQNLNIYAIRFGYLGIYGSVLMVLDESGRWWPAHRFTLINAGASLVVDDPHMTMRAEIVKAAAGASTPQLNVGSWGVDAIGDITNSPIRFQSVTYGPTSHLAGAERYLFTVLNDLTLAGGVFVNKTPLKLTSCSFGTDVTTGNNARIRVRRNCPLTGPMSFVAQDPNNSASKTDVAATGGFTTGATRHQFQVQGQTGTVIDLTKDQLWLNPGESFTFTAETTNTQLINGNVRFEEAL